MASSISLIDADGTSVHLAGGGGAWNGSGTPWTAQGTSPYRLSMNDVTGGVWTPAAAAPELVLAGGPPFRLGSELRYRGLGPVTEQVGVQLRATSHDNAVGLLRTLRRALGGTLTGRPPILVVQPDGASQPVYYEILSASVQELPQFINQEAVGGASAGRTARALITWVRTPLGGRLSSGETLINAVTVNNTGTGTPDNIESLGTSGSGDYIREGGPLNVRATLPSSVSRELLIGTVASRTYTANTNTLVTSSTAFLSAAAITSALNLSALITNVNLKVRIIVRATNASANMQLRVQAYVGEVLLYESPAVAATTANGTNVLLDMGGFSIPQIYRTFATGTASMTVEVGRRSTTGAATTGALGYIEVIPYYTWAQVSRGQDVGTVLIESFVERSGLPALPIPSRASTLDGSNYLDVEQIRGRAPIYIPGASLYLAWRHPTTFAHVTSETATLTATHSPLYYSLRGGG